MRSSVSRAARLRHAVADRRLDRTGELPVPKGSEPHHGGIALLLRLRWVLLRELVRTNWPMCAVLLVTAVVPPLFSGVFMVATGLIVGAVPATARAGFDSPSGRTIIVGLVVAVICYAIQMTLTPLRSTLSEILGRQLEGRLRNRVMRAVLTPAGVAHLEQPELQDRVALAQAVGIGENRPRNCVQAAADKYGGQLGGFISAVLLLGFAWWAPLVLIAGWVLLGYAWTRKLRD